MTMSNDNQIQAFLHCGLCVEEVKAEMAQYVHVSPRDYARLAVGWTPDGLQVWCNRHDCNVIHIDFEGKKHPADTTRKESGSDARAIH